MGRLNGALSDLTYAREIYVKQNDNLNTAICDMNLGVVYTSLGESSKALALLMSARTVFEQKGLKDDVVRCTINIANIYADMGKCNEALELLESSSSNVLEVTNEGKGTSLLRTLLKAVLESVYLELRKFSQALACIESARQTFKDLGEDLEVAMCDSNIAAIYIELGDYDKALSTLEATNKSHGDLGKVKWSILRRMARVYGLKGYLELAKATYKELIECIEDVWRNVDKEDLGISFLAHWHYLYHEFICFCVEHQDARTALEYLEQAKSRNLARKMLNHEPSLHNVSNGEKEAYERIRSEMEMYSYVLGKENGLGCPIWVREEYCGLAKQHEELLKNLKRKYPLFEADERQGVFSYNDIRSLVYGGVDALVELFPTDKGTVVCTVLPDRDIEESTIFIRQYDIWKLYKHVNGLLERYYMVQHSLSLVEREKNLKKWEDYADGLLKEMYEQIFCEILPYFDNVRKIKGIPKVVVMPYWYFDILPLHAMFTEVNCRRRYLIDDFMIAYAPSARILKRCQMRRRERRDRVFVLHANPADSGRLMFSNEEAKAVGELFDGARIIYGSTKSAFVNDCKEANILHFTGHANYQGLILHSDRDGGAKEEFNLAEIVKTVNLPSAYLVTLSACETGLMTPIDRGDEYGALASSFLHAGAATVISSLWCVPDMSTTIMMRKLYEFIKEGHVAAESLREAQLWLKDTDKRKEHLDVLSSMKWIRDSGINPEKLLQHDLSRPYYWAKFICSGAN